MKKLINKVNDVVTELLEGVAKAHPNLKVSFDPMFVTRRDKKIKVALVSGGGSGHEPMHGGFVGMGMLDGACPGQMFTSPTPDQMYECAKEVDSGKGVLFIVKNYTGDILNFEMAVELLHADGIEVQSIVIDDDVAVKDSLYTAGRRGVATTVIAEKILGAAAEKGYSLAEVAQLGHRIANNGRSIGVALSPCTVPAAGKPSFELSDDEIEFGVGIHGEPGIERKPLEDADTLASDMVNELLKNVDYERQVKEFDNNTGLWSERAVKINTLESGDNVVVMINNLGATPQSELYIVYRKVVDLLEDNGIKVVRNMIGTYCTALDMQGISISLLKVDEEMLSLYDEPVNTSALRAGC